MQEDNHTPSPAGHAISNFFEGGSGRASTDTPTSTSSFQGGCCAVPSCLPCLETLTALAARGTSASCRLPAWHRPSPAAIPLLRGWTNPWHLGREKKALQRGPLCCRQSDCVRGQERTRALFNHTPRDWDKSVCGPDAHLHSPPACDLARRMCTSHQLGPLQLPSLPGLNRTMARRHPSSDLSICMSFILDTSSVKTLHVGGMGGQMSRDRYRQQGWGLKSIRDRHWEYPQLLAAARGSCEGQPCHALLIHVRISSNQGPEHQVRPRSRFAQLRASEHCLD